jgi:hypothetical protein
MNPTQQSLIAYKLRIVSQLADSLTLCSDFCVIRKGLHVIANTACDSALEVQQLEPEETVLDDAFIERICARARSSNALSRS